jgi:hypothetical protein
VSLLDFSTTRSRQAEAAQENQELPFDLLGEVLLASVFAATPRELAKQHRLKEWIFHQTYQGVLNLVWENPKQHKIKREGPARSLLGSPEPRRLIC